MYMNTYRRYVYIVNALGGHLCVDLHQEINVAGWTIALASIGNNDLITKNPEEVSTPQFQS